MKIEFYLTGHEIHQLRELMDNAPLNPYAPVIVKILAALPISGNDTAISLTPAGTAPASENAQVAERGFSEVDALVEFQRNRNRATESFDASLSHGMNVLRRGNPLYDLEWYV